MTKQQLCSEWSLHQVGRPSGEESFQNGATLSQFNSKPESGHTILPCISDTNGGKIPQLNSKSEMENDTESCQTISTCISDTNKATLSQTYSNVGMANDTESVVTINPYVSGTYNFEQNSASELINEKRNIIYATSCACEGTNKEIVIENEVNNFERPDEPDACGPTNNNAHLDENRTVYGQNKVEVKQVLRNYFSNENDDKNDQTMCYKCVPETSCKTLQNEGITERCATNIQIDQVIEYSAKSSNVGVSEERSDLDKLSHNILYLENLTQSYVNNVECLSTKSNANNNTKCANSFAGLETNKAPNRMNFIHCKLRHRAKVRKIKLICLAIFYTSAVAFVAVTNISKRPQTIYEGEDELDFFREEYRIKRDSDVTTVSDVNTTETAEKECDYTDEKKNIIIMSYETLINGGWVVHVLIGLYTFSAISAICDVYFVPALEHICEDLKLDGDVAGATFMAAASSAPEFCTSFIGIFVENSDVGLGAIVGSSIFNLLAIIGLCGIFAGMPVKLSWYPLTRDSIFYTVSVLEMLLFMWDEQIYWYEACFMVFTYLLYILTMMYNKRLEAFATARDVSRTTSPQGSGGAATDARPISESRRNSYADGSHTSSQNPRIEIIRRRSHSKTSNAMRMSASKINRPLKGHANGEITAQSARSSITSQVKPSPRNSATVHGYGSEVDPPLVPEKKVGMATPPTEPVSIEEEPSTKTEEPQMASALKLNSESRNVSPSPGYDTDVDPPRVPEKRVERPTPPTEPVIIEEEPPTQTEEPEISEEPEEDTQVAEYENPFTWPESRIGQIYYIIVFPITFIHAFTIPDSRIRDSWQARLYFIPFVLSIVYLGIYTYIMVWSMTNAAFALSIPSSVTGLTILAAGTSVPDCLSSIFVARDGFGDMAVSNAIGSNVFDILLCLGIPWLITSIQSGPYHIVNAGMFTAGSTLAVTIAYLVISLKFIKWTLTPTYGFITLFFYVVVIAFCVLVETGIILGDGKPKAKCASFGGGH